MHTTREEREEIASTVARHRGIYERWTGMLPSRCLPKRSGRSKGCNSTCAAGVLGERVGDPAPIVSASAQDLSALDLGRSGGPDGGAAIAEAAAPKKRKAIAQKAAPAPFARGPSLPLALTTVWDEIKAADVECASAPFHSSSGTQLALPIELPLRQARKAFERAYFEQLLVRASGSLAYVAEKSGIDRTHLYRKLKALGITIDKRG